MKTEKVKLTDIKPYWRNPRKNEAGIPQLKESIAKFGYQSPLIVDKNKVIIVGHSRFKALNQLYGQLDTRLDSLAAQMDVAEGDAKEKLESLYDNLDEINKGEIKVLIADELDDKQAKEYRITDNKLSEFGEWDNQKLNYEFKELGDVVGFNPFEIDRILKDPNVDFSEYTAEDIRGENEKIISNFSRTVEQKMADLANVICPFCSKTFKIDKDSVKI